MCMSDRESAKPDHVIHFDNASICNDKVEIKKFKINYSQIKSEHILGTNLTSVIIGLKEIEFEKDSNDKGLSIFFNKQSKEILEKKYNEALAITYENLILKFNNNEYILKYSEKLDTVCLTIYNRIKYEEIKKFINLISFYYRIPLYSCLIVKKENGKANIHCRSYKSFPNNIIRDNPREMFTCDEINNVQGFLFKINTNKYFNEGDFLERLVNNYVNSEFYESINRYIAQCISIISIPPKVLSKEQLTKENNNRTLELSEIEKVKNLFKELSKQGCQEIDFILLNKEIQNKHFKTTKERGNNKVITNFIQLRDEIIHGLASEEITKFLEDDEFLITKLELLNFVLIANMLGLKSFQLDPFYNNFNIFET